MKKILVFFSLFTSSLAGAYQLQTVYNPFTGKPDYINVSTGTSGGGGSGSGTVNSSNSGNVAYYSVPGSSPSVSGTSNLQVFSSSVVANQTLYAPSGVNASTVSANTISIGGASNTNGTVAVTGSGYFNGHLAAGDSPSVQSTIGIYGLGTNGTTAVGVQGEVTPQTGSPATAYGVFGQANTGGAVEYGVGGLCQATSSTNCSGGTFSSTGGTSNSYGIQTSVSPTRASSVAQYGVSSTMNGFAPSLFGMYTVVNSSATSATGYYANLQGFSVTNRGAQFIAQSGTTNIGVEIDAGFGTNNYAIRTNSGQVLFRDSFTVTSPLGETVSYNLNVGSMTGAGLTSCSGGTSAVTWNSSTNQFGCNTISGGSGGYALQPATVTIQGNAGITGSTMSLVNATAPFTLTISTSSTGINQLTVSSAIATKTSDFLLNVSSSNGVLNFGVQNDGHIVSSGTIPGVSSCGTSPTMDPSSTDSGGKINVGSVTATACTLTFANAYASAPICIVSDDSTGVTADISSISSTAVTFGFSISLAGGHVWYICVGGRGG